jgi:hypothetical protein
MTDVRAVAAKVAKKKLEKEPFYIEYDQAPSVYVHILDI